MIYTFWTCKIVQCISLLIERLLLGVRYSGVLRTEEKELVEFNKNRLQFIQNLLNKYPNVIVHVLASIQLLQKLLGKITQPLVGALR